MEIPIFELLVVPATTSASLDEPNHRGVFFPFGDVCGSKPSSAVIRMEAVDVPQCEEHLSIGFSDAVRVKFRGSTVLSGNHVPASRICTFSVEVVPWVYDVTFGRHFLSLHRN